MTTPSRTVPGAVPPVDAATLAAVVLMRRPTVRLVAAATGYPITSTWKALERLRAAGWVTWDGRTRGTLRATCRYVPLRGTSTIG